MHLEDKEQDYYRLENQQWNLPSGAPLPLWSGRKRGKPVVLRDGGPFCLLAFSFYVGMSFAKCNMHASVYVGL